MSQVLLLFCDVLLCNRPVVLRPKRESTPSAPVSARPAGHCFDGAGRPARLVVGAALAGRAGRFSSLSASARACEGPGRPARRYDFTHSRSLPATPHPAAEFIFSQSGALAHFQQVVPPFKIAGFAFGRTWDCARLSCSEERRHAPFLLKVWAQERMSC